FILSTKSTTKLTCGVVPSGLLVQSTTDTTAHLLINDAEVTLNGATLYLHATPKDRLEITVIAGKVTVSALGISMDANAGQLISVRLGGKDGLTAAAQPSKPTSYTFAAIETAPLGALP